MKKTYDWISDLGDIIEQYIKEKKLTGFKFETQSRYLRHFDSFYYYNGYNVFVK